MWRRGLNQKEFAAALATTKGTVSRWLSGERSAPCPTFLSRALQDAWQANEHTTNITLLSPLKHPVEWFQDGRPTHRNPLASSLIAPPEAVPPPVVTLDRLAFVFRVGGAMRPVFERKMTQLAKGFTQSKSFRNAAILEGLHVSWGPKYKAAKIDPTTGEVLDGAYARIDVQPRLLNEGAPLFALYPWLATAMKPSSIEVTLLDLAIDYLVPSVLMLHDDRRVRKAPLLGQPTSRWLRNHALQLRFGSRKAERLIRVYDKAAERADRQLQAGPLRQDLEDLVAAEQHEDHLIGESIEPEDVLRLASRFSYLPLGPSHTRGQKHVHRVEASLRPRRSRGTPTGPKGFDRRPYGLVQRLLDRYDPFRGHYMVHLGVVPPESFWRVPLVGAKIIGAQGMRKELGTWPGAPDAFDQVIEAFSEGTAEAGLEKPGGALVGAANALQEQLDAFFTPPSLMCAKG